MPGMLHISRVVVTVETCVADALVEQNMGYLPWVLGENLAEQVLQYVEREGTGYFPAMDFFRTQPDAVDPALLGLIDEVARFCGDYARRELRRRLSRAFSNIGVGQEQCVAYGMPRVRPSQPNARERLARHYSPNVVKLELVLSNIEKQARPNPDPAGTAVQKVLNWARTPFESLEVVGSRALSDG
jgi:hypothetical protein